MDKSLAWAPPRLSALNQGFSIPFSSLKSPVGTVGSFGCNHVAPLGTGMPGLGQVLIVWRGQPATGLLPWPVFHQNGVPLRPNQLPKQTETGPVAELRLFWDGL